MVQTCLKTALTQDVCRLSVHAPTEGQPAVRWQHGTLLEDDSIAWWKCASLSEVFDVSVIGKNLGLLEPAALASDG